MNLGSRAVVHVVNDIPVGVTFVGNLTSNQTPEGLLVNSQGRKPLGSGTFSWRKPRRGGRSFYRPSGAYNGKIATIPRGLRPWLGTIAAPRLLFTYNRDAHTRAVVVFRLFGRRWCIA